MSLPPSPSGVATSNAESESGGTILGGEGIASESRQEPPGCAKDLKAIPAAPSPSESGYRTIVADPPWPIKWSSGSRKAGVSSGSTRVYGKRPLPYKTMGLDDLRELGEFVRWKSHDDAHLFMWTLDRFLLNGWTTAIMRAWGFEPLPHMMVWRKANPGLGRCLRPAHEFVVIGRRGNARLSEASLPSVFDWRQPYENGAKAHSAKPDGALDTIESLSPGPYLEMFARRARFGWDYYGDESLGTAVMPDVA